MDIYSDNILNYNGYMNLILDFSSLTFVRNNKWARTKNYNWKYLNFYWDANSCQRNSNSYTNLHGFSFFIFNEYHDMIHEPIKHFYSSISQLTLYLQYVRAWMLYEYPIDFWVSKRSQYYHAFVELDSCLITIFWKKKYFRRLTIIHLPPLKAVLRVICVERTASLMH